MENEQTRQARSDMFNNSKYPQLFKCENLSAKISENSCLAIQRTALDTAHIINRYFDAKFHKWVPGSNRMLPPLHEASIENLTACAYCDRAVNKETLKKAHEQYGQIWKKALLRIADILPDERVETSERTSLEF